MYGHPVIHTYMLATCKLHATMEATVKPSKLTGCGLLPGLSLPSSLLSQKETKRLKKKKTRKNNMTCCQKDRPECNGMFKLLHVHVHVHVTRDVKINV